MEYTTREAANLLRLTLGDFLRYLDTGILRVERRKKRKQLGGRGQALVTWKELASAAMLRWTVMEVHDALGEAANITLPRLLRPLELKGVRLPEYLLRLLEQIAERQRVTVEEYVYTCLLAVETEMCPDVMEQLLPGFKEAINFPDGNA